MEIQSKYAPSQTENKWYAEWMKNGLFKSSPDEREPYCIVIPPPNVTGVLHMGHVLNNTLQDVLVRRARMLGKNALWLPGTDHASIATEAKVVAKLKSEGISKSDITRDEFLSHAMEWKDKHGSIILEQLKKLGCSCDWDRTKFTMDADMYESVIVVFVDLFRKGLIYRGVRMVNWDPKALTAVSDEEVIYKEVNSKLYYCKYIIEGASDTYLTVATTRPETILGDTAVCVHPDDERYKHLIGKSVIVPVINRPVPVIADEYVDPEFGTGALKITPAHDINDYNIGIKHKLPVIDIFNENGTLNEKAMFFVGTDRFEARKLMVTALTEKGLLEKTEDYINKVGCSERTDEVIEPRLSMQWFMKMDAMAKPALDVVMDDSISFHPQKFKNTYKHWMENVRDWCISRQLWWGQRIPAWYLPDGQYVVAINETEALVHARQIKGFEDIDLAGLKQDEDVLDTWFSSWLWPISVFDGIRNPDNEEIKYYYPTNDLVTAPEILFFWVARMIMAGIEYRDAIPFTNVYLTGIVRDKLGRKMSKSLGNSPDPLDLIDKYGADGVRAGMLLTSPAGNDLPFDEMLCEQGRNFSNKIWNALRLVKGWEIDTDACSPDYAEAAVRWFDSRLSSEINVINDHFSKYRISDALMAVYKLIWDDFCSWYLEMIKPPFGKAIDLNTYNITLEFFEKLLKLLHPFMPFITEEIYHTIKERKDNDFIMMSQWPAAEKTNDIIINEFNAASEIIMFVRNIRKDKNITFKEQIPLFIKTHENHTLNSTFNSVIIKLCNLSFINKTDVKIENAFSFVIGTDEFYIPASGNIDKEEEINRLEEEINYLKGFLTSVEKKLNNERFVNNAPAEVVEIEKKKQNDAISKMSVLQSQIDNLKN